MTLAAGASQIVNVSVGNPNFFLVGAAPLVVTGTSQGNASVSATLNLAVKVPNALAMAARFQPWSQNTPAVFPLIVQNIRSVQDTYTAAITNTTGNIQSNLVNLDGTFGATATFTPDVAALARALRTQMVPGTVLRAKVWRANRQR